MKRLLLAAMIALCLRASAQTPLPPAAFPVFRAFDINGVPLSGGLLYSYVAGTTTPLATYTDATGATPNTNPVVLDSTGSAKIFLGSATYKLVLQNSLGVQQWSVDNISSSSQNLSPSQTTGTALVGSPGGGQTLVQPAGTTLAGNSINGVFNEEVFSGASVNARVTTAIAACSTNPCIVQVPPNAPVGVISAVPPANVLIQDRRFLSGQGFAQNSQSNLHSSNVFLATNAANASYESVANSGNFVMDLEAVATAGGTTGNAAQANSGALILFAPRTGGSRPVWGQDINFQYSNQNNIATGLEIDSVNNSGTADPGTGTVGAGVRVIASGASVNGVGVLIQGSGTTWTTGEWIQNYSGNGLTMTPVAARTGTSGDIFIVPPDSTATNCSILITGSNCAGALFTVHDDGSVATQTSVTAGGSITSGGTVTANGFKAGSSLGITHTLTLPCGTAIFTVGILTAVTGTC